MRQHTSIIALAALVTLAACGGSNSDGVTNPKKPNNGTMSARIDGAAWSAISIATGGGAGTSLIITGSNITQTIAIIVPLNSGTGTKTMGQSSVVSGTLIIGSQQWAANPAQGGTGSITLTTVASGHVAGTFSFTMAAQQGATPATRQVTSSQFDVTY